METMLKQILDEIAEINVTLSTLPTKGDIERTIAEQQKDIMAMLTLIAKKQEISYASIEALNTRLFKQESELILLKAK